MPLFSLPLSLFSWFAEAPLCSVSARPRPPPPLLPPTPRAPLLPAPLTLSAGLDCDRAPRRQPQPRSRPSEAGETEKAPTVPKNSEPRRNTTKSHRTEIKKRTPAPAPDVSGGGCGWRPAPLGRSRCGRLPDASGRVGGHTYGVSRGEGRPISPPPVGTPDSQGHARSSQESRRRGGGGEAGVGSARRAAVRLARAGPAPVPDCRSPRRWHPRP